MAPRKNTREIRSDTGDGWRKLGFYHEPDHARYIWRFVGSRAGLGHLVDDLRRCADTEQGDDKGLRLGPYEDLLLYHWDRPGIDDQGIYGPPDALTRLADLITDSLGLPGSTTTIGPEYASDVEYRLHFEVKEDDFDPTTVVPESVDDTRSVAIAEGAGAIELDEDDDDFVVSPSVPCYYYDPDANLSETHGIVYLEGFELVMQYETKDVFLGHFRSGPRETRLPLEEVSTVRLKRGFFGGRELRIQTRDMMGAAGIPNAKAGLIRLKFKRANRQPGEALAAMLEDALGLLQGGQ